MIKLGVIYGGISTESEVSKESAKSVLENLNRKKYDIYPILIDKNGDWYEDKNLNKVKIENIIEYLQNLDIVFPVLHGLFGEDGTIQGLFEIAGVKYIGCKVLASSVGMDKAYTKMIFEKAKLNQAKYLYVKKYKESEYIYVDNNLNEKYMDIDTLIDLVEKELKYPVFVKPSNSGSSVGVNKAVNRKQLKENIEIAVKYDTKVLIEQGIIGKEVECAVLGNSRIGVEVTNPGEIVPAGEYYSFDSKYKDEDSKTLVDARISGEQKDEVKKLAKKAFNAIDGNGISRVDFFVENDTGKIYINEINTMPGFTSISMYPKLFGVYGYDYGELLDKIIGVSL